MKHATLPDGRPRCQAFSYSSSGWQSYQCRKAVKGELADGTPVCGVHLAAARRRAENQAREAREREARAASNEVVLEQVKALEEVAPRLRPQAVWSTTARAYEANRVKVDARELLALLHEVR